MDPKQAGGRRLAGVVLGSVALAVVTGGVAAWIGHLAGERGSGGALETLDSSFFAVVGAFGVAIPVFLGSLALGMRRSVPAGRQLATWVTIVVASAAVPFLLGWATEASRRAGLGAFALPVALLVVVTAAAAIGGVAGIVAGPRVRALVGATAVVVVVLALAGA